MLNVRLNTSFRAQHRMTMVMSNDWYIERAKQQSWLSGIAIDGNPSREKELGQLMVRVGRSDCLRALSKYFHSGAELSTRQRAQLTLLVLTMRMWVSSATNHEKKKRTLKAGCGM